MSKTPKCNLHINQGATYRKDFIWKAGGAPVDLSDWKGRMQIRPEIDSGEVIADLTTENGGLVIYGIEGKVSIHITSLQTEAFSFEDAVYDIELVALNGDVDRFLEGSVRLSPEVTRP